MIVQHLAVGKRHVGSDVPAEQPVVPMATARPA
jgi:hypothetical protein